MEFREYDLIWKKGSFFEKGHWRLIPKQTFGEKVGGQIFVFVLFLAILLILLSIIVMTLPFWACLLAFQMKREKRYIGAIICILGLLYFHLDLSNNWLSSILFNGWTSEDGSFTDGIFGQKYIYWFKIINYTAFGLGLGFILDYLVVTKNAKNSNFQFIIYLGSVILLLFTSLTYTDKYADYQKINTSVKQKSIIEKQILKENYKGNGVFNSINEAIKYPDKVKELKIGFGSHQIIPLAVRKMKNLELLQMEYNQLQGIPEWIGELQNLKKIDLHKNNIKKVPKNLFKLKKLKELNLSQNKIFEIPNGIEELKSLKFLYLSDNPIEKENALMITHSLSNVNIYGLKDKIKKELDIIASGETNYNKKWRSVQIKKNRKWGVINENQEIIIPFEYDNMIRFDKESNSNKWYSLAKKNGKYGVIDTQNKLLVDFKYDILWPFYGDGFAPCKLNKKDKFGLIDIDDNVILDFKYDGLHHVKKGYVAAEMNGLWGYIDLNENIIVDFKYKYTNQLFDLGQKELKNKIKGNE